MPRKMSRKSQPKVHIGAVRHVNTLEALDEKLWEKLPEELLFLVLTFLPWDSIVRLRLVCKKWLSTFQNQKFLQIYTQVRAQVPICVVSIFSIDRWVWSNWKYTFASGDINSRSDCILLSKPVPLSCVPLSFPEYRVINTAEYFILLRKGYSAPDSIIVVLNPMNGSQRQITMECEEDCDIRCIGMVMCRESGVYKILSEGYSSQLGDSIPSYHLYDSLTKSWNLMFSSNTSRDGILKHPVYHEGVLYCLSQGKYESEPENNRSGYWYSVYYAKRNGWAKLAVPCVLLGFPCLFGYRGRLMLAAGIQDCQGILQSAHIWMCDAKKENWVEVQRMPDELLERLLQISWPSCCYANGDYLCFGEETCLVHYRSTKKEKLDVVMYNLSINTWSFLSNWSGIGRRPMGLFVPNLDAVP